MKFFYYTIVVLFLLIFCLAGVPSAFSYTGEVGPPMLSLTYGSRALSLGGAYSGVANDVYYMDSNPAGGDPRKVFKLALIHQEWIADVNYEAIRLSYGINDRFFFGLGFTYLYLPFVVITLYATLEKFDFSQVDAAMDLGARPWRAFVEITLPQTKQGMITAFIFVFIPILGEYIAPKLVGGTSGTMIAIMMVNLFRGFQFPQLAAVALGIAVFIIALLFALRRYIRIEEIY